MTTQTTDFWKLFKPAHCSLRLKGEDKDTVLGEVVETMVKTGALDEAYGPAAIKALVDREKLASTGVGMNVAIPHVKIDGLEEAVVNASIHSAGVEWSALDGEPVHILFTVLRPARPSERHDPERHLDMMGWITRLCRHADFRRFALSIKNRTELVDLLREMSGA